jgi:hypothetical protein
VHRSESDVEAVGLPPPERPFTGKAADRSASDAGHGVVRSTSRKRATHPGGPVCCMLETCRSFAPV